MIKGTYISESAENLISRVEQVLGGVPVLDLTNPQVPTLTTQGYIRSLAGSCHSITIKNVVSVTDSSIVICTGSGTGTCAGIPANCGAIGAATPDKYYNFVATVNALVAETGVEITFKYVLSGVPMTEVVSGVSLLAGSNNVYAFATNQSYTSGTDLVLYGAEATSY